MKQTKVHAFILYIFKTISDHMKTQEELLYLEADRYLQELAQRKNSHDIDKTISSNEMRDAIWGLLKQENAIEKMTDRYVISVHGQTILQEGGFHKRYIDEKEQKQFVRDSVKWSKIAAIASAISVLLALANLLN